MTKRGFGRTPRVAKGMTLLALLVCPVLVASLPTEAGPLEAATLAERPLRFPADRVVGELFLRDTQSPEREGPSDPFHPWLNEERDWRYLGAATGQVIVPSNARVHLRVNHQAARDLSWLSALRPDDLYILTLDRCDDRGLEFVVRLTGLRNLSLFSDRITDRGMRRLTGLQSLEALRLPESATNAGLAQVAKLRSLKSLTFSNTKVTDAGLAPLAQLKALEELHLGGRFIGDAGLDHVAQLPRLRFLELWGKNFTGSGFVHLTKLPSLRTLVSLRMATVRNESLAHLAKIPNLENLYLYDNAGISDKGVAHLRTMRSLKYLDLGRTKVTYRSVEPLAQIQTLECLHFPGESMTDEGLAALAALPNLRELSLGLPFYSDPARAKKCYTDRGLGYLSRAPRLETLDVGGPYITDEGLMHIAAMKGLKQLTLYGCAISNDGLARLAPLRRLESFHVASRDISVAGLANLNALTSLTRLRANYIKQDNSGLDIGALKNLEEFDLRLDHKAVMRDEDLACLAGLTRLRKLVFQPEGVSDDGLAHLAGLENLEWLTAGGPRLTDAGLKHLSKCTAMEYLTLTGPLTDAGLAHFANMKQLKRLFYRGDVTDAGLRRIESMRSLHTLIIQSDSTCSRAAIERLRAALPNLTTLRVTP